MLFGLLPGAMIWRWIFIPLVLL